MQPRLLRREGRQQVQVATTPMKPVRTDSLAFDPNTGSILSRNLISDQITISPDARTLNHVQSSQPHQRGPTKGAPLSISITTQSSLLDPEQKLQPQQPKATDHQYQTEQATSHAIPNTEGSSSVHTANTMEREDKGNPKKCPSPSTAHKNDKPVQKENRSTLFQAEAPEAPLSPSLTWEETRSCTEPQKFSKGPTPKPFAAAQISRHLIHPGIKQSSPKSLRRTMISRQTWHPSSYHQNTKQNQLEQRTNH